MTPRGSYRTGLETHLDETRDHAVRVGARLDELGQGSNPLTAVVGLAETVLGQAVAFGKAPFDLLRGSGGDEKVLKNAKDACASETLEIATYTAIERLAGSVGDDETAKLAASIRADEEKMLQRIMREIPELTEAVVQADVNGEPSYDLSTTGAAETVREAGQATTNGARKTTPAAKRTARRARKVTGAGQRKGAATSDRDVAIPSYDTLTAEEITGKLAELSQIDLVEIDSYERKHKNRSTILNRITSLRGEEPTAAADPAGAHEAGTDFAAAEGSLRTAADLGDVRAAHRLGILLWRERSDPHAAVAWLDRAAQADDPAAGRDLGLLLREHGDLHGAHYWLSRAAERDGEARHVLAELNESP
jgi:ferritin-like metal-binding protein YciE